MTEGQSFGEWLEQEMKRAGYPRQSDLARALNVAPPTVNKWIKGTRTPDIDSALALARALKLSTVEVFARLGWHGTLSHAEILYWNDRLSQLSEDGRRRLEALAEALIQDERTQDEAERRNRQ